MVSMLFFSNSPGKRCSWHSKHILSFLLLICVLVLPACGEHQLPPEQEEGVLIYAALNPVSSEIKKSVAVFNNEHTDIQIKIHDYSDEGGLERLQTELVLGRVPDIMEMHYFGKAGPRVAAEGSYRVIPGSYADAADECWMPYRQMAQKGYLEDLWPYIENDPDFGRDGVLEAPLKAAEVGGGLYILFQKVTIFTLTGRESVVGNRYSWTMEDIMEVLSGMPEGSTILRYNMTRRDAFFNLLRFSLDRFMDWEAGECHFDSQGFLDLVQFLEKLPEEVDFEDPVEAEEEVKRRIKNGQQMLEGMMVDWQKDIIVADAVWQERAAFPGYPTADGSSGSFFYPPGSILAMSAACQNKNAAWEYIRRLLKPRVSKNEPLVTFMNIPINANDYELLLWGELQQTNRWIAHAGSVEQFLKDDMLAMRRHFKYGPDIHLMRPLTEEEAQRHRDLIDHTTQLYWPDDELSNIVWDSLGPYFAGDWTLDHTIALLQNRVGLYLNEQK